MRVIILQLHQGDIDIKLTKKGGGVIRSSSLHTDYDHDGDYKDWHDANCRIDAIESLILAHACAGVDVEAQAYIDGIQTALDAICNA